LTQKELQALDFCAAGSGQCSVEDKGVVKWSKNVADGAFSKTESASGEVIVFTAPNNPATIAITATANDVQ
jgi:hypothetical protein